MTMTMMIAELAVKVQVVADTATMATLMTMTKMIVVAAEAVGIDHQESRKSDEKGSKKNVEKRSKESEKIETNKRDRKGKRKGKIGREACEIRGTERDAKETEVTRREEIEKDVKGVKEIDLDPMTRIGHRFSTIKRVCLRKMTP